MAATRLRGKFGDTIRISLATLSSRTPIHRAFSAKHSVAERHKVNRHLGDQQTVPEHRDPFPRRGKTAARQNNGTPGANLQGITEQPAQSLNRVEYDEAYVAARHQFYESMRGLSARYRSLKHRYDKDFHETAFQWYKRAPGELQRLFILKAKTVIPTVFAPWGEVGLMPRLARILTFTFRALENLLSRGWFSLWVRVAEYWRNRRTR